MHYNLILVRNNAILLLITFVAYVTAQSNFFISLTTQQCICVCVCVCVCVSVNVYIYIYICI